MVASRKIKTVWTQFWPSEVVKQLEWLTTVTLECGHTLEHRGKGLPPAHGDAYDCPYCQQEATDGQ